METVILAAGRGRRMRPLTDTGHKTLLPVNHLPVIDHLLATLESAGLSRVLVVTGYDADRVEAHLRERFGHLALRFVRNENYATTNNIISLAIAFEHLSLEEDLLLIEADLVLDPSILKRFVAQSPPDAALLDHYQPGMDGTVVTVTDGFVTSVIPPHLQSASFDFTDKFKTLNVYKFSAGFCRSVFAGLLRYYSQTIDGTIYYELILGILIYLKQARIHAAMVEPGERWAELDTPHDIRIADWKFQPGARRALLEESLGGYWTFDVADFCFLRNMYWPTPAMLSELRRDLPALIHGYGSSQSVLDRKLRWWLLCRPDRATAVAGLSQVYPWLRRRLAGMRVLIPDPTFGEYPRAFPRHVTYPDRFSLDLEEVEGRLGEADVCVVVSPNNPTGTEVDTRGLHALIARRPDRLFLVDESFQGFSEQPSLVTLLEESPLSNVLALVSLSKALGIPGVRLGYVYTCAPAWRRELLEELPIWNLGSLAEHVLEVGLKYRDALEASLRQTRHDRSAFAADLRGCAGVDRVVEGGANFVVARLAPLACPEGSIVDHLLVRHRIYVKDVSARIADGRTWLRLAVRLPHENAALVEALGGVSETGDTT